MEKINIAELLKDCPKGMELDCALFENLEFDHIDKDDKAYPIICRVKTEWGSYNIHTFTKYGYYSVEKYSKCVIFPKGKTTWEEFQRPFKDGDIVISNHGDIHINRDNLSSYCCLRRGYFDETITTLVKFDRLATEEEKAKLFDAIKSHGYKWNTETKKLEKLIEPKFKVGDKIRHKINNKDIIYEISAVYDDFYGLVDYAFMLDIKYQDEYELVLNKFDINTLKPFDEVLVRSHNSDVWECDFFSLYNPECSNRFHCIGAWYDICIPYIGNEHLRGTTNDCDEYYKTWE